VHVPLAIAILLVYCTVILIYQYVDKFCCCRYGLIIPNKTAKSKPVVNPLSVFANDDDDEVCKDSSWIEFVLNNNG